MVAKTKCVHHWLIEEPDGLTSKGKCRNCHEGRVFDNTVTYSEWYGFNKTRKFKTKRGEK